MNTHHPLLGPNILGEVLSFVAGSPPDQAKQLAHISVVAKGTAPIAENAAKQLVIYHIDKLAASSPFTTAELLGGCSRSWTHTLWCRIPVFPLTWSLPAHPTELEPEHTTGLASCNIPTKISGAKIQALAHIDLELDPENPLVWGLLAEFGFVRWGEIFVPSSAAKINESATLDSKDDQTLNDDRDPEGGTGRNTGQNENAKERWERIITRQLHPGILKRHNDCNIAVCAACHKYCLPRDFEHDSPCLWSAVEALEHLPGDILDRLTPIFDTTWHSKDDGTHWKKFRNKSVPKKNSGNLWITHEPRVRFCAILQDDSENNVVRGPNSKNNTGDNKLDDLLMDTESKSNAGTCSSEVENPITNTIHSLPESLIAVPYHIDTMCCSNNRCPLAHTVQQMSELLKFQTDGKRTRKRRRREKGEELGSPTGLCGYFPMHAGERKELEYKYNFLPACSVWYLLGRHLTRAAGNNFLYSSRLAAEVSTERKQDAHSTSNELRDKLEMFCLCPKVVKYFDWDDVDTSTDDDFGLFD